MARKKDKQAQKAKKQQSAQDAVKTPETSRPEPGKRNT